MTISKSTSLFLIFFWAATFNSGITLAAPTNVIVSETPKHNGNSSGEAGAKEVDEQKGQNLLAQFQRSSSVFPTAGSLCTKIKRKSCNDQNGDEAEDEKVSRNQEEDLAAELQSLKWNPQEKKTNFNKTIAVDGITTNIASSKSPLESHKGKGETEEWESGFFDLNVETGGGGGSKTNENTLSLSANENLVLRLDKSDYTPKEIADYIFWTGDEQGVAATINDLVQEGLMTRKDDVIRFLEAVKGKLNNLQNHYSTSAYLLRPTREIKENGKDNHGSDDDAQYHYHHNDRLQQQLEHVKHQHHHYYKQTQLMEPSSSSTSSLLDMPEIANNDDENPSLFTKTKGKHLADGRKELDSNESEDQSQHKTAPFSSLSKAFLIYHHHENYRRWKRSHHGSDVNERRNLHSSFIGRLDKGKVAEARRISRRELNHQTDNERGGRAFPVSDSKGIFELPTKGNERKFYSSSQLLPIIADYASHERQGRRKDEDPTSTENISLDNGSKTGEISGADEDDYERQRAAETLTYRNLLGAINWFSRLDGSGFNDEKYDAHYSNILTTVQHVFAEFGELGYRERILKHSLYLLVKALMFCSPAQPNHLFLDKLFVGSGESSRSSDNGQSYNDIYGNPSDAVEQLMRFIATYVATSKIPKDLSGEIVELLTTALDHRTKEDAKDLETALEELHWVAEFLNRKLQTRQRRERSSQSKKQKVKLSKRMY